MGKINDIDLVNYVINKGATLKEAAEHFDVSISTVKKAMQKIKVDLNKDSEIYTNLNDVSKENEYLGKIKGGQSKNSGIERNFDLEQIALLAMQFISENLTLSLASGKFEIPKSTLWDNFRRLNCDEYQELYNDLLYVYDCHNKAISNNTILDVEERGVNHNQAWLESLQHSDFIKLESLIQKYNLKLEEHSSKSKK